MRYKTIVLMLALALATWAQTGSSNSQPNTTPAEKTNCACCDRMASADAKDGQSCARHMAQNADGKQIASCCGDKSAKSCCDKDAKCMKDNKAGCCAGSSKDKTALSCCQPDCGKSCGKGCCSGKNEKASRSCCNKTMQS